MNRTRHAPLPALSLWVLLAAVVLMSLFSLTPAPCYVLPIFNTSDGTGGTTGICTGQANCGSCSQVGSTGTDCINGLCVPLCKTNPAYYNCNNDPRDGCESQTPCAPCSNCTDSSMCASTCGGAANVAGYTCASNVHECALPPSSCATPSPRPPRPNSP